MTDAAEKRGQLILLTGAGFSRNWGGWLADEAFEFLLGAPEIDGYLRHLLWQNKLRSGGFESALASVQAAYTIDASLENKHRLDAMTAALVGMFNAMNRVFSKQRIEPVAGERPNIRRFLSLFDAIFTLNQDALLEFHFIGHVRWSEKWKGSYTPYLERLNPDSTGLYPHPQDERMAPAAHFTLIPELQPYYKLHGSSHWFSERAGTPMLVMGTNKLASIKNYEILEQYHKEFADYLSRPNTRLMVIGYGFGDQHINETIGTAAEKGLQIFIIDPAGADVLDKRDRRAQTPQPIDNFMEKLMPRVIGASRRPLLTTFSTDGVEYDKVMRFFA
jgi:hypothetical protein